MDIHLNAHPTESTALHCQLYAHLSSHLPQLVNYVLLHWVRKCQPGCFGNRDVLPFPETHPLENRFVPIWKWVWKLPEKERKKERHILQVEKMFMKHIPQLQLSTALQSKSEQILMNLRHGDYFLPCMHETDWYWMREIRSGTLILQAHKFVMNHVDRSKPKATLYYLGGKPMINRGLGMDLRKPARDWVQH